MKAILFRATTLITLIYSGVVYSQNLENFKWSEPVYLTQHQDYANADQTLISRVQKNEFNFDERSNKFEQITLNHFVVQINTEKGLKQRLELEPPSESRGRSVLQFKLRIIHPDGTFYEFKKSDLKEKKLSQKPKNSEGDEVEEDEEDEDDEDSSEDKKKETYMYYDLSTLKIGDQLEYYSVIKFNNSNMSGAMFNYQGKFPVQNFQFELNVNKEFTFLFKPYNGAPPASQDSTNKVRNVYTIKDTLVSGLKFEKFSNYAANQRKFIYKLDGYDLGKKRNIFNIEDISSSLYKFTYNLDKKERSVVKKVIKLSKINTLSSNEQIVVALENYLKNEFAIYPLGQLNEIFSIENMYQFHAISGENAAKLMANILKQFNIEHELVWTCNRFDYRYDKDFETSYFMDRFMLFIPGMNKFLDPNSKTFRLGIIPSSYTHNHALMIREITTGGLTSGIGKVKFIDALSKDKSIDKIETSVSFDENVSAASLDMTRSMTGYFASDWQPIFRKTDANQRVRFENSLFKFVDENLKDSKTEFLNVDQKDINVKPFVVKGKGVSAAIVEQRGDSVIFKIGKLIGPQTNLYDDETRVLPIERSSARTYERLLTIDLPNGFNVQNLNDLNKDFQVKNETGRVAAMFKSTYELTGNQLVVRIEEWFEDIIIPAKFYAEFRDVINASSDFAKLELILLK